MTKQFKCEVCGQLKTKLIPAGVSKKTGKPYNEFYACAICKAGDKPKTSNLEEKLRVKFAEIDKSIKNLENLAYGVKTLEDATSVEDEETGESLPF